MADAAREHAEAAERRRGSYAPAPPAPQPQTPAQWLLRLQRSSGNHAVARLLQRQDVPGGQAQPAATARTAAELTQLKEQIVTAIAQHETGARAIPSALETSSGTPASYTSQIQATAPWVLTALLALDAAALRQFNLTRAELIAAQNRANAGIRVYSAVMASPANQDATAFTAANVALVGQSGFTAADIQRLVTWRNVLTEARRALREDMPALQTRLLALTPEEVWDRATERQRRRVGAARRNQMNAARRARLAPVVARMETLQTVAATADATAVGAAWTTINDVLNFPGEDRASWARVAVSREPPPAAGAAAPTGPGVGQRVQDAAEAGGGLTLGRARIGQIVDAQLATTPNATEDELLLNAARRHNPGNAAYPDKVLAHFHEIRGVQDDIDCDQHPRASIRARRAAPQGGGAQPAQPQPAGQAPPTTGALESSEPGSALTIVWPPLVTEDQFLDQVGLTDPGEQEPVTGAA